MFSDIAPRYDLLNHLLSLNVDRLWRRQALGNLGWQDRPRGVFLDACAGTFDLALGLAESPGFQGSVVASDFALPMLRLGAAKPVAGRVHPTAADTVQLPFADATFDGAIVGFGIRNLASVAAGFRELARVLKPGARLVVLEFTTPTFAPLRGAYLVYLRFILPVIGRLLSGHPTAYSYLPVSVAGFPSPVALKAMMEDSGLGGCRFTLLTGGIAAIHWGTR